MLSLVRGLLERGLAQQPAVLMRGYGAAAPGEPHAEARELARALGGGVPVLCNPDRVAGAARAAEQGCDAVVLDDGFQHRRLARDLDIVLIDATDPFGGGHYLPWGRLLETPEALARAGVLVITRPDLVPAETLERLRARLKQLAPRAGLSVARQTPKTLRRLFAREPEQSAADLHVRSGGCPRPPTSEAEWPVSDLQGKPIVAVCGIGNPEAFFEQLARLGADVRVKLPFRDHCRYREASLNELRAAAEGAQAEWVVTTEKDAVKLEPLIASAPQALPVWALGIETEVVHGGDALWRRVEQALGGRRA